MISVKRYSLSRAAMDNRLTGFILGLSRWLRESGSSPCGFQGGGNGFPPARCNNSSTPPSSSVPIAPLDRARYTGVRGVCFCEPARLLGVALALAHRGGLTPLRDRISPHSISCVCLYPLSSTAWERLDLGWRGGPGKATSKPPMRSFKRFRAVITSYLHPIELLLRWYFPLEI
ncbi:hypothetical protein R1flu_023263 [Riccia fluitans]|uniref:Uncharacterized protein n=1 Tax=Riccia fluitans TaxID=41844 RepID=A0ABD1XRM2_9MARC